MPALPGQSADRDEVPGLRNGGFPDRTGRTPASTANGPVSEPERAFARRFRKLREDSGLTQLELAEQMRELGYGAFRQNTVFRIEAGMRFIGPGPPMR